MEFRISWGKRISELTDFRKSSILDPKNLPKLRSKSIKIDLNFHIEIYLKFSSIFVVGGNFPYDFWVGGVDPTTKDGSPRGLGSGTCRQLYLISILIFGFENGLQMSYRPDNMMNLKQNRSSNLILTSKKAQILQNLSKMTKNGCPNPKIRKFFSKKNFRRQKIESCKSSETRFAEVSRRSEPCSQTSWSPRRDS